MANFVTLESENKYEPIPLPSDSWDLDFLRSFCPSPTVLAWPHGDGVGMVNLGL